MSLIFFEDVEAGELPEFGAYAVTEEEILGFARAYDPQPFHLDAEAGKRSLLGGLAASGWHTAAMAHRMLYEAFLKNTASMGGPGVEELKWLKPVRPGDLLHARRTLLDKRASKSRPEMGITRHLLETFNGAGECVMTQQNVLLLGRRGFEQKPIVRTRPEAAVTAAPPTPEPEKLLPLTKFLEDFRLGEEIDLGARTFTKEDIIGFATAYDPQPFHLDEIAASQSHFGRLAASGWETAATWMKQWVAHQKMFLADLSGRGGVTPEVGPSPGFRDLKWPHPVYAGDLVHYTTTIENRRATSRPGWGIIFTHNKGINQDGVLVFEFKGAVFWQMRP